VNDFRSRRPSGPRWRPYKLSTFERLDLTGEQVLRELARIRFSDIRQLFDEQNVLRPIHSLPEQTAAMIASFEQDVIYDVHRDLKPENILYNPQEGRPIVADFGIASFEEDELYTAVETKDETRLANFQYAAPESSLASASATFARSSMSRTISGISTP
jgi:tRNA A-37 threonylcarbamoyl transferase component Bud32